MAAWFWQTERRNRGPRNRGALGDRAKLDQAHSLVLFGGETSGDFHGKPRFANATGSS